MHKHESKAVPPGAPARETAGARVRNRLLDSAEKLFAERGYFGASVRDITEHAGVRLAAINYHFGTKEALFRGVVLRRAPMLNQERLDLLDAVPKRGASAPRTATIVAAFVRPTLARARENAGWRRYLALVAQVASSRLWVLALVADQFNPVAMAFIRALGATYPRASEQRLQHAYQLLLASTLYASSDNRRLDSLTRGRCRSKDFDALADSVVTFTTAGIVSLCGPRSRRDVGRPHARARARYRARQHPRNHSA
jgi:AcrR family transcriptional regulator